MPNEQTERPSLAGIVRGMPCSCAHRYKCNHCGEWQPDNHPFCGRCELPCSLQTPNKCARCQALALAEEQERELENRLGVIESANNAARRRGEQLAAEKQAREKAEAALAAQVDELRNWLEHSRNCRVRFTDENDEQNECDCGLMRALGTPVDLLAAHDERVRREALESAADVFPETRDIPELWLPRQIKQWLREHAEGGGNG